MNNKQILAVQSLQKQHILKGNGIDIHKLIGKLPRPKRGWVPPGYRYLGPLNPLEEQVDEEGNPLPGSEPTNALDEVAMNHDKCYRDNNHRKGKLECDRVMLDSLKKTKSKTFGEKVMKKITQGIIGTKRQLGLSIEQEAIIKSLKL